MAARTYKLVHTATAQADIAEIRDYTLRRYGKDAAKAYSALLRQAFKDIRADPFRPGSKERAEIGAHVRSYHITLSRQRAGSKVRSPRHLILYFLPEADEIVVSRVLHDSRDLARHVPEADIERARDFNAKRRSRSKGRTERER